MTGAQFPQQEHIENTVQRHRNLTRTVEKQHTPHQERMFPSSKKSKFTLAETCPRQQNTLLEEEEKNGLSFVWKQKRQTRRKMSCRKKHGRAGLKHTPRISLLNLIDTKKTVWGRSFGCVPFLFAGPEVCDRHKR